MRLFLIKTRYLLKTKTSINMENLGKSDINRAIKINMDSNEFKAKVEKIVKEKLKGNEEIEDRVLAITKNAIAQLFKTLWVKKNTWQNNLTNNNY